MDAAMEYVLSQEWELVKVDDGDYEYTGMYIIQ